MISSVKNLNRLLWPVFIVITALYIVFTYYGFPVLTYDSECFLPAAISVKNGNGLVNPFYNAGFIPGGKFLFYPPLFPLTISAFMFGSGALALYGSILLVNLISIFISLLIFQKLSNKFYNPEHKNVWFLLFAIFWIPANCTFIVPNNSRPEMLCRLLLYLMILLQLTNVWFKNFVLGIIYAAAFITSPIFGLYLTAIIFLCLICLNSLQGIVSFLAGGGLVLILFLFFYPYTISDLIDTMKKHSENVIHLRNEGFSIKNFITYHLLANNASFGILLFIASITTTIYYFKPVVKKMRIPYLITLVVLVFLIWYFSFRNLPTSYYMYVLSPLFLLLVAYAWFKTSNRITKVSITLLVILVSFSFLRLSLSFITNAGKARYSLVSVNNQFEEYRMMSGKKVAVSNGLWPFFTDNFQCIPSIYSGANDIDADYIIQQQYASGKLVPDSIPNYVLVKNTFDKNTSTISKLLSNKYAPFYQYAVYKRK